MNKKNSAKQRKSNNVKKPGQPNVPRNLSRNRRKRKRRSGGGRKRGNAADRRLRGLRHRHRRRRVAAAEAVTAALPLPRRAVVPVPPHLEATRRTRPTAAAALEDDVGLVRVEEDEKDPSARRVSLRGLVEVVVEVLPHLTVESWIERWRVPDKSDPGKIPTKRAKTQPLKPK